MRRRWKLAAAALIVVAIIVLAAALSPYGCFLDVLNAQIARGCEFRPFYAGLPGLPATRDVIPELGALEDAFPAIRAEALAACADLARVPQMADAYNSIFLRGGAGPVAWATARAMRLIYGKDVDIFDRIGSPDWRTFNLVLFNRDVPGNAERCPVLVSLLKQVPGMQSALISVLAPGAYIPPHSDPAKGVVRYHLGLQVPKDRAGCFIEVDGRRYSWAEGAGVLFDDVHSHWVRNRTDEFRMILFVDILRPLTGRPKLLQRLANAANRYHPGVRRLIRASRV